MNFPRVFSRLLHYGQPLRQDANRGKTAKQVLKFMNNQSSQKNDVPHEKLPSWKKQTLALKQKFNGERWNPAKKLSRAEMEGMRVLRDRFPQLTASDLAERYKVSPEVVRRILKSKWQPTEEEMVRIHERWKRRGERIQELYSSTPDLINPTDKVIVPKKISISSARDSSEFIVRKVNNMAKRSQARDMTNSGNKSATSKNKLFLLQRSTSK